SEIKPSRRRVRNVVIEIRHSEAAFVNKPAVFNHTDRASRHINVFPLRKKRIHFLCGFIIRGRSFSGHILLSQNAGGGETDHEHNKCGNNQASLEHVFSSSLPEIFISRKLTIVNTFHLKRPLTGLRRTAEEKR